MPTSRVAIRRHDFYQELADVCERFLIDQGVSPDVANLLTTALVDHLADYWGGQVISFPKDVGYKLSVKELEVYDKFSGVNADDLAREYGMSIRGMNKLLARVREKIKASRESHVPAGQLDLLDSSK